jgi:type I restriction enzyme S subunit
MGSEWHATTLGEFVRLQRGHDLTAANQRPGPYPVMGSAGQNGTHDEFIARGPGVVIGRSGASIGRVHFTHHDYWPHNTCLYVTDFLGNDPKFAFYLLGTLDLANYNSGSVQPSLNRNYVYAKSLWIPGIDEQREIAGLLGTLDERIDNLRATNTTLEAIAQALFKSWFVDFDPVHAKAEGRKPEAMDAATAALFPSEFEESELGPIPKGWRAGRLGDVSSNPRNQAKPGKIDPDTPYFGLEHMPRKSIALVDHGTADGLGSGKFWFEESDILFGKLRPYFHKVGLAPSKGICSTDILVLRPLQPAFHAFLLLHASSDALIDYATRLSNGAKMPRSSWKDIANYPICIPPDSAVQTFNEMVAPMLRRIKANVEATSTLANLRDALLPRLISGKLRLPEAGATIEELLA